MTKTQIAKWERVIRISVAILLLLLFMLLKIYMDINKEAK